MAGTRRATRPATNDGIPKGLHLDVEQTRRMLGPIQGAKGVSWPIVTDDGRVFWTEESFEWVKGPPSLEV